MGRRVSNGVVGAAASIGQLSVTGNTLTTTQTNTNLVIDPQGSGVTQFVGNIQINGNGSTGGEVRLGDADVTTSASAYYIALRAPTTVTPANYTLTFPAAVTGVSGYVLSSDTSGNLSWVAQTTAGVSVTDQTASGSTHYLYGGTATSGQLTTINSFSTRITFVPSTGELTSAIATHGTLRGSTSASATLTLNGTSNATKAAASILMNDNVASTGTSSGTLVITGGLGVSGRINAANFDGIVGGNSAAAGTFTTLTCTSLTETSSIALKENITPIENALEKILALTGYVYDRKDGSAHNEAGLIKEEVEQIIPNLVSGDGVHYTKLGAYLIESIKSLHKEILELKSKI